MVSSMLMDSLKILVMPESFNRAATISIVKTWIPALNQCGNDNLWMHFTSHRERRTG